MDIREQIRVLKEKRANLWQTEMQARLERAGDTPLAGEELAAYERAETDVDAASAHIDLLERQLERERLLAVGDPTPLPGSPGDPAERQALRQAAFVDYLRNGRAGMSIPNRELLVAGDLELRALGVGAGAAGGYTVPEGFLNKITETQKYYGGVADVANVIVTDSGQDLPWVSNDDTAQVGALLSENTQITDNDVTFGVITLGAYVYTSKQVKISYQLLQDTAFDLEGFLARKFGQRLGRIHNTHFTTGTGAAQPKGVVTGATTGKTTASATAITMDELIDLQHSIDIAYREPDARWMFSDAVLQAVRKLKDTQNRYLWEPSTQQGQPSLLLGRPYTLNQDMATIATGNTTALYGDFDAYYVIRQVRNLTVLRLDERYADFLQVGFLAFDRVDGTTDDTSAVRALKQA